ncbi:MAG: putative signal transducing protein [Capsulimonadaceae bacterium]
MPEENPEETIEEAGLVTPMQEAAAREASLPEDPDEAEAVRSQDEANVLVDDLDAYAAEVDPDNLEQAEAELREWKVPTDPLDTATDIPPGTPLVSVFTAMTEAEANIIRGVLQASGIPASLKEVGVSSFYAGAMAFGEAACAYVLVPEPLADAARAAITDASSGDS